MRSRCAPNVWAWYRMVSHRYPRPRARRIGWLVMPCQSRCPPRPRTRTIESPRPPRGHDDRSGSRRRAAAWRTRTKHPNLKPTPFCRPGSRTASLGYEASSYGPTDGLARTSPVGVGPSWLATKSHTAVQASVRHRSVDISPRDLRAQHHFISPPFPREIFGRRCSKNSKRARALSLRSLPASARGRVETPKKR